MHDMLRGSEDSLLFEAERSVMPVRRQIVSGMPSRELWLSVSTRRRRIRDVKEPSSSSLRLLCERFSFCSSFQWYGVSSVEGEVGGAQRLIRRFPSRLSSFRAGRRERVAGNEEKEFAERSSVSRAERPEKEGGRKARELFWSTRTFSAPHASARPSGSCWSLLWVRSSLASMEQSSTAPGSSAMPQPVSARVSSLASAADLILARTSSCESARTSSLVQGVGPFETGPFSEVGSEMTNSSVSGADELVRFARIFRAPHTFLPFVPDFLPSPLSMWRMMFSCSLPRFTLFSNALLWNLFSRRCSMNISNICEPQNSSMNCLVSQESWASMKPSLSKPCSSRKRR
mmetsp:Transcript_2331/g.8296  ORF Transcript_2331/g.8296 Transcript_2331/m.8296 type:complete len:344 (-) Transcript_2331:1182-2213(-)